MIESVWIMLIEQIAYNIQPSYHNLHGQPTAECNSHKRQTTYQLSHMETFNRVAVVMKDGRE